MSQGSTGSISTLIVDDEQLAREELSYQLKDFPEIDIIAASSNGLEAVDLIEQLEPELVFLDVQMPGIDGLGVIAKVRASAGLVPHFRADYGFRPVCRRSLSPRGFGLPAETCRKGTARGFGS